MEACLSFCRIVGMSAGRQSSITIVALDFGVRIVKVCKCVCVVKHALSCITAPYTCVYICVHLHTSMYAHHLPQNMSVA